MPINWESGTDCFYLKQLQIGRGTHLLGCNIRGFESLAKGKSADLCKKRLKTGDERVHVRFLRNSSIFWWEVDLLYAKSFEKLEHVWE